MPLNKTAAAYRPEMGSLAQRVIDLISRNIDDDYASSDLVAKLGVASNSVSVLLATPVGHGLLRFERTEPDDLVKTWRAGPALREWLQLQQAGGSQPSESSPAAPAATLPVASAARTARRYQRLDPFTVPIRSGVPIPSVDVGRAVTAPYAVLWDRLKTGDSVVLPDKQAASLCSYLKKNRHAHTVRRADVGVKAVWRNG